MVQFLWDPKTEKTGDAQPQAFLTREQRKGYEIPRVAQRMLVTCEEAVSVRPPYLENE